MVNVMFLSYQIFPNEKLIINFNPFPSFNYKRSI